MNAPLRGAFSVAPIGGACGELTPTGPAAQEAWGRPAESAVHVSQRPMPVDEEDDQGDGEGRRGKRPGQGATAR